MGLKIRARTIQAKTRVAERFQVLLRLKDRDRNTRSIAAVRVSKIILYNENTIFRLININFRLIDIVVF